MSTDTPLDVEIELDRLFAQQSGADRVRMACAMFDDARAIVTAAIKAQQPDIAETELRAELFDRFYGDDFDAGERARIAKQLRRAWERDWSNDR